MRARRADDFEGLVELDLSSARHHASIDPEYYLVPEPDAVAVFLKRRLADPDRDVLVAEVGGRIVGAVDIAMVGPRDPGSIVRPIPTADLGISVAQDWRGRGIGHMLMSAAEANARARGAERMILDVSAANEGALRFYHELGYREHGHLLYRSLHVEA